MGGFNAGQISFSVNPGLLSASTSATGLVGGMETYDANGQVTSVDYNYAFGDASATWTGQGKVTNTVHNYKYGSPREGIPVALHESYFPVPLVAGTAIERPRKIRGGAHTVIEDPVGPIRRHIARSVDEISGRMPTPDEVRQLRLPPGVPVFRILRTVYDSEGQAVEVQDSLAAGDRHGFCYEVDMR